MKKLKVLELFAGIGAPRQALENLGIEAEYTPIEYDKKVINVYNKLYGTNHETKDITTWKKDQDYDVVIGGFPCQPFSLAGKGLGFDDPRGKLFKDTLRVIEKTNPNYVVLENVSGILREAHRWVIMEIQNKLMKMGYYVIVQEINSKYFIPQQRRRVFIMASKKPFNHIEIERERESQLENFLETSTEKKYLLTQESMLKAVRDKKIKALEVRGGSGNAQTITTKQWRWNNAGVLPVEIKSGKLLLKDFQPGKLHHWLQGALCKYNNGNGSEQQTKIGGHRWSKNHYWKRSV